MMNNQETHMDKIVDKFMFIEIMDVLEIEKTKYTHNRVVRYNLWCQKRVDVYAEEVENK